MRRSSLPLFFSLSLLAVAFSGFAPAQTLITGFGLTALNPLNPVTDFLLPWTGTQTTNSVSVTNVSNQAGGIFSILNTPITLPASPLTLRLTGTLTGTPPLTDKFQISLYDSNFNSISYNFAWSSFSGGPVTQTAPLALSSGNFNGTVGSYGLNLFGGNGDTVSFTFNSLSASAVPEPSTYLLLGFSVLALGLFRRKLIRRSFSVK